MNSGVGWLRAVRLATLFLSLALGLGLIIGYPAEAVAITAVALLGYSLYQLRRLHHWLQHPEEETPDAMGVWGGVFDRMHAVQRENREAQGRLRSSVSYLRDSLGSMRDAAIMVDRDGFIQWSNKAAERLLGLRYPQDGGQALLNLVRMPDFKRYFLGGDFSSPAVVHPEAGEERQFEVEISRFGDGDRLVFVRDVTARARLEQTRRDFVANVSHELRTPLTVIMGYLSTILSQSDELSPRFTKALQQMDQQASRMEALLKDLLWLSRIESVRQDPLEERVNMCGLLEELRDEIHSSHPERKLVLELATKQLVNGDYRQLHSAASNLVQNALKYSAPDGAVTITWQESDGQPVLTVKDEGIGIDNVHLPRLTERFYRVDDSRSTATGGTGLGLAIVKHVVASHDAELSIHSQFGRGSAFSIRFPRAESPVTAASAGNSGL